MTNDQIKYIQSRSAKGLISAFQKALDNNKVIQSDWPEWTKVWREGKVKVYTAANSIFEEDNETD